MAAAGPAAVVVAEQDLIPEAELRPFENKVAKAIKGQL